MKVILFNLNIKEQNQKKLEKQFVFGVKLKELIQSLVLKIFPEMYRRYWVNNGNFYITKFQKYFSYPINL